MKKIISIMLISVMLLNFLPISVYATAENDTEQLKSDIQKLCAEIFLAQQPGEIPPYQSWDKANALYDEAIDLIEDENATLEELNDIYERLCDTESYLIVSKWYAKASYVFALEENNDDGWYEEVDWNDFTEKRENLRLALNDGDKILINSAYRAMYDSFITMTFRYNRAGDLNKDGVVNISDTTLILKHNVGLIKLNSAQIMLAQCYDNNTPSYYYERLNVSDATNHQKAVAGYEGYEWNNEIDNMQRFIVTNALGDEFNYLIFSRSPNLENRTKWISQRISELQAEGVLS